MEPPLSWPLGWGYFWPWLGPQEGISISTSNGNTARRVLSAQHCGPWRGRACPPQLLLYLLQSECSSKTGSRLSRNLFPSFVKFVHEELPTVLFLHYPFNVSGINRDDISFMSDIRKFLSSLFFNLLAWLEVYQSFFLFNQFLVLLSSSNVFCFNFIDIYSNFYGFSSAFIRLKFLFSLVFSGRSLLIYMFLLFQYIHLMLYISL